MTFEKSVLAQARLHQLMHCLPISSPASSIIREYKRLIIEMLIDLGCDPEKVYLDLPRMRTSTAQGYLTTGIAYAFHPPRDAWYSAPFPN